LVGRNIQQLLEIKKPPDGPGAGESNYRNCGGEAAVPTSYKKYPRNGSAGTWVPSWGWVSIEISEVIAAG
jgi:hypothetical protein